MYKVSDQYCRCHPEFYLVLDRKWNQWYRTSLMGANLKQPWTIIRIYVQHLNKSPKRWKQLLSTLLCSANVLSFMCCLQLWSSFLKCRTALNMFAHCYGVAGLNQNVDVNNTLKSVLKLEDWFLLVLIQFHIYRIKQNQFYCYCFFFRLDWSVNISGWMLKAAAKSKLFKLEQVKKR